MPNLVLAAIEYGGYISAVKLAVFGVLFLAWIPLVGWVHNDAKAVGTRDVFWSGLVLGVGAGAILVWQLVPVFIVGLLVYVLSVAGTSLAYVKHRNARVMDFDRVLTVDHIKNLLVSQEEKLEALKSFVFITANRNEVPVPEPRTPDFFGYKMAYDLLTDATWRRASDIHYSPTPQEYKVTYYVDGAALKQPSIPKEQAEYLIHFLKDVTGLDLKEKRKPQKGTFTIAKAQELTEWEVTTAGSTAGEQMLIKLMTVKDTAKLEEIGLMPDQFQQLSSFRGVKEGLFVVSGPKKSGATSTFYALLRNHDAFLNSINTLEKAPSSDLLNITQNVYSPSDSGTTTYGKKLEEIIRMGPDIVGVADCEDSETARAACAGAKDGKLVYVQMAADSVMQATA